MALQDRERLRLLVSDYYHGLTTVESYRHQRAQLLDNIGADVDDHPETITTRQKLSVAKEPMASATAPTNPETTGSSIGAKKRTCAAFE